MEQIPIQTEYITLGQFLKLTDCISTGGSAKHFLQETKITINGQADNRRGRKIYPDDIVYVESVGQYQVVRSS